MLNNVIAECSALTENYLNQKLKYDGFLQQNVINAMNYSLFAGGKRIRPFLMLEFYRAASGCDRKDIANFAAAIEMIHTYSLIHDDLPCMDDDDFRRGKPSCHKQYGEAIALLAGDGLLTEAFSCCADYNSSAVPAEKAIKAVKYISDYAGILGMIGGQVIDIESEGKEISVEKLKQIHYLKTSALISAACKIGALLGKADDIQLNAAEKYGKNIGLAFQIVDDILDNTSTGEKLGKPIGSDASLNKTTYFSVYGEEKSRQIAKELTIEALEELDSFSCDTSVLKDFAFMLLKRES